MSGHVIPHPGCTTAKGQPLRRTCGDTAWPSPPVAVIDVNLFLRLYNFPLQTNQAKGSKEVALPEPKTLNQMGCYFLGEL